MKAKKDFTHPDAGKQVFITVVDNCVSITFVTHCNEQANDIGQLLLAQLEVGELNISMRSGPPENIEEVFMQ